MRSTHEHPLRAELRQELTEVRGKWLWFVVLGAALVVMGAVALGAALITGLATALVIGALLVVSGGVEVVGAFWSRGWSGFFFHLLSGLLSLVVGVMFLRAPLDALLALTLLLACLLMVGGIFKIITALTFRFTAWGWPLVSGLVDLVLGVMIWMELPTSALWVIGLVVGISLIFRGFNWIGIGMVVRRLVPPGTD